MESMEAWADILTELSVMRFDKTRECCRIATTLTELPIAEGVGDVVVGIVRTVAASIMMVRWGRVAAIHPGL